MSETTIDLTVTGMTCTGCSGTVRAALEGTPGVAAADVDHMTGTARVTPDGSVPAADLAFALDEAVERAGYRVAP
jgi:copper chaperone CopZ